MKGRIWIQLGLLLIAAALCLTAYNLWEAHLAGSAAQAVVERLTLNMGIEEAPQSAEELPTVSAPQERPVYLLAPEMEMPETTLDGEAYIGVLRIPALELELPVHSQWSYPRLKTAPCRYSGSAYLNDLVICAHNYAAHFGGLKDLREGDAVSFTDMDGNVFHYQVAALEALGPTAVEEMTAGEWPLTLFTCTPGGQSRVAVRCDLAAPAS